MRRHVLASALIASLIAHGVARGVLAQGFASRGTPPVVVDRSERVVRSSVAITARGGAHERGSVLASDGRILTALGPLAGEQTATVRYPNGHTDAATVVAIDPVWGLALLEPRTGHWTDGVALTDSARRNGDVRWTEGDRDARSVQAILRARHTYVGASQTLLRDAWEFDPHPPSGALGSAVVDVNAQLVAVIVPPDPSVRRGGAPAPFGVPASVVRELALRAGNTAHPWLGLIAREPRPEDGPQAQALGGLVVTTVTAHSPADRAGVRAGPGGDAIVGADGHEVRSVADLGTALSGHHPGDEVPMRLVRAGVVFDLTVQLGDLPSVGP